MSYLKSHVKHWKWHLIPRLLLVAIMAIMLILSDAQTSEAATLVPQTTTAQCKSLGKLIASNSFPDHGAKIGELDLYYNSSTGYNCVYLKSGNATWGKAKHMFVGISRCNETKPSNSCTTASSNFQVVDSGTYKYEAGPVGVYAKGHCIEAEGKMEGVTVAFGPGYC